MRRRDARRGVAALGLNDHSDAFGHRDYAKALDDLLDDVDPPFTLGLLGAWGVGKTTILRELARGIASRPVGDTVFVSYSAWRADSSSFRREFLIALDAQLVAAKALKRRRRLRSGDFYRTTSAATERVTLSPARWLQLLVAIAALVGAGYWAGIRSPGQLLERPDLKVPVAALIALAAVITFIIRLAVDVIQPRVVSVTSLKLEEPERFAERFQDLIAATTRKRVIIAIDDLDRMSAKDAVEVLRTVKTFLEPATNRVRGGRSTAVVFVIAADRDVLRSHVAAELKDVAASSQPAPMRTPEQLADDYLAKFFNAVLTVRPVLDDDMHQYMRRHLEKFVPKTGTGDPGFERILRMCVVGLRHNPRRVDQFVDNLRVRWKLICVRERSRESDGDARPLSSDLPTIVKLALIEEEWPHAYECMRARPGLLARWTALANAGEQPDGDQWSGEDWPGFAAFLRASTDVAPSSLRPFLRLRRSVVEAHLPDYDAFHDAAISLGSPDAIAGFVERADQQVVRGYEARMTDILREALASGDLDGTVHCLEAAVCVGRMTGTSFSFYEILRVATAEPALKSTLQRVSPRPLIYAARVVGGQVQQKVEEAIAEQILDVAARKESPSDAARALTEESVIAITPEVRRQLCDGFAREPLVGEFEHYLPLIGRGSQKIGVPKGAAARALAAVVATSNGPRPVLRAAGPAWQVVVEAAHADALGAELNKLFEHAGAVLAQAADRQEITEHLEDLLTIARSFSQGDLDRRLELTRQVADAAVRSPEVCCYALELCIALSGDFECDDVTVFIELSERFVPRSPNDARPANFAVPTQGAQQWTPLLRAAAAVAMASGDHPSVRRLAEQARFDGVQERIAELYLPRIQTEHATKIEAEIFAETMDALGSSYADQLTALIRSWADTHESANDSPITSWLFTGLKNFHNHEVLATALHETLANAPDSGAEALADHVIGRLDQISRDTRVSLLAALSDEQHTELPPALSKLRASLTRDLATG